MILARSRARFAALLGPLFLQAACAAARASTTPLSPPVGSVEVSPAPVIARQQSSKPAVPASVQAFQRACDLGSARGCNDLGVKFLNGEGVPKDEPRAVALLERGCELKLPMACFNLGYTVATGLGTARDPDRAAQLYETACTGKIGLACNALGNLLSKAEVRDTKRALRFFEQSCSLKTMSGCVNAAWLYKEGKEVARDHPKAARYYRLGCDANIGIGCTGLATMLLRGEGGLIADPLGAGDLYEKGCRYDVFYGCYSYGLVLSSGTLGKPDAEHARPALQSSCDAGNAEACSALGSLIDSDD